MFFCFETSFLWSSCSFLFRFVLFSLLLFFCFYFSFSLSSPNFDSDSLFFFFTLIHFTLLICLEILKETFLQEILRKALNDSTLNISFSKPQVQKRQTVPSSTFRIEFYPCQSEYTEAIAVISGLGTVLLLSLFFFLFLFVYFSFVCYFRSFLIKTVIPFSFRSTFDLSQKQLSLHRTSQILKSLDPIVIWMWQVQIQLHLLIRLESSLVSL